MNVYEMMNKYTADGKPFIWTQDINCYVVVNTAARRVVDWCKTQQQAMASAHRFNCYSFAMSAIKAKDDNAIAAGLATNDAVMRSAFQEALVDEVCAIHII